MMTSIKVRKYNLPDSYLFENDEIKYSSTIWIPENICIVLGRSNNPKDSLFTENVLTDRIPIYKRPSGGETVLLTPQTLIISIALKQSGFKGGSRLEK